MLLAGFVGVSAYSLLYFYFQNNNDSALLFKMADTFNTIGVELPEELALAQQNWLAIRSNENSSKNDEGEQNEDDDDEHENELSSAPQVYETYEGELTSIFILPSLGKISPFIRRKSVVFPTPLSPIIAIFAGGKARVILSKIFMKLGVLYDTPDKEICVIIPPKKLVKQNSQSN
jgi:hypothetical protein